MGTTRAPYTPRLSRRHAASIPYAMQPRDERVQEVLAPYRCMTAPMIADALQEPVQSVRNRLQRMFKHGFCRRYHVGLRHLVYMPHWVSRGQNPYLLHDLMASEFRLTLNRSTQDWHTFRGRVRPSLPLAAGGGQDGGYSCVAVIPTRTLPRQAWIHSPDVPQLPG